MKLLLLAALATLPALAVIPALTLLPDPVPATAVEVEYVAAPHIPGPPRPLAVEPPLDQGIRTLTVPTINVDTRIVLPLGVEIAMRSTNHVDTTFEPVGCQLCERAHHHRVVERYTVTESNVLPTLVAGELHLLSVGTARTNRAMIYTTNYVEHPAVHVRGGARMVYPPLPPAPALLYQQNRSNYLRKVDPTRGAVNPQQYKEAGLAALPRRSNTSTFVPPTE